MPQNIYDDEDFFAAYSRLPRSQEGLDGAPEWSTVQTLLPEIAGARILDLGCGFGAFDRWALDQGAASIIAIDLSANMIARARALDNSGRIDYRQGAMERLEVPGPFDLIYSALAFHYVEDFAGLCAAMRRRLVSGGRLVATVEHPVYTAPSQPQWIQGSDGRELWPIDGYLAEGRRVTDWLAPGVVKYHRTITSYVDALHTNGFAVARLIEWGPDAGQVARHPQWRRERDRPMFLLIAADARSG